MSHQNGRIMVLYGIHDVPLQSPYRVAQEGKRAAVSAFNLVTLTDLDGTSCSQTNHSQLIAMAAAPCHSSLQQGLMGGSRRIELTSHLARPCCQLGKHRDCKTSGDISNVQTRLLASCLKWARGKFYHMSPITNQVIRYNIKSPASNSFPILSPIIIYVHTVAKTHQKPPWTNGPRQRMPFLAMA